MASDFTRGTGCRPTLLATAIQMALAGGLLTVWQPVAHAQASVGQSTARAAATRTYDIPAGPLDGVLAQFVSESGTPLASSAEMVRGRHSDGLHGAYAVNAGLQTLLAGTGLEAVPQADGSYSLQTAAVALPATNVKDSLDGAGSKSPNPSTTVGSKTPLTQREIPQSVTVIPQEQIQQQSLQTLDDAMRYAPGVTVFHGDSDRSNYYARGFAIDTWLLDGVPTTQNLTSVAPDLAIYDRVEVLSGPDGLLNGFGSPGGSVNLVRKRAPSVFTASADVFGGTGSHAGADVDIGGPLNDAGTLRGRVVASDSYQHLVQDTTWRRDKTFYGTLEADVTSSTTVRLGASYNRIDSKQAWVADPIYASTYAPVPISRSTYLGAPWNHDTSTITTAFLDIEQKLANNWKAKLAFNHIESRYSVLNESILGAASDDNQVTYDADNFKFKDTQDSLDLFVDGPFKFLGREHHLTFGASYERENLKQTNYYCSDATRFCEFTGNVYTADLSAEPAFDGVVYGRSTVTNQYGLYGNARISLADPLTLVVGARATWWNESYYPVAGENPFGDTATHYSVKGKVTPYAGLIFDLNDTYSVYASYTGIFVPQADTDVAGNLIKPIEGSQYEVGIKGEYLGGRLNTSAALFMLTEQNRAMSDPRYPDQGYYIATGRARSKGLELKVTGNLTADWTVFGGYTYNDTYYMDASTNPDGVGFSQISPKHQFKLWTNYRLPGHLNKVSIGGGTLVTSGESATDGTGTVRQGGYATVDLRLGYQISKPLSAAVNVTNLFDRKYYDSINVGNLCWGAGREVLLTLRYAM